MEIRDFYADSKVSRLKNIQNVGKHAGPINHITGDVNFLAMGLKGKRNILTIHDFGFYENPVHSIVVKTIYKYFWFYFPLKFVDIVTVVSEFTKEKLIRYFHFPESRIRVIPDPVKPVFKRSPKLQLNSTPRVLQIGSGGHKNVMNMIEALKGTGYHVDIVGWPSEKEQAKLKEYNISYAITNSLTDEQVFEKYQECDILFFASYYEGFGMPIIEAQAVGRPVITSNIGAMKEVGEGSAILVDPNKPAEIRAAMDKLVQDKGYYAKVVEGGFKNAAKYDYVTIAEAYYKVYQELQNKTGK
jgi:glycosyltransferase involved in cell wall biosynthesis